MKTSKWAAVVTVLLIAALGGVFLGLDILDIDEDFRLHLPTPLLNTVFISAAGFAIASVAARKFVLTGLKGMPWLGCGALALGIGSLARVLLGNHDVNELITIYEGGVLVASALHLTEALLGSRIPKVYQPRSSGRKRYLLLTYFGTTVLVGVIVMSALQGITPAMYLPEDGSGLRRDVVRGLAAILFFVSSLIGIGWYCKNRDTFHFWQSMGLLLLALGVIFMSQGVDNRIAWLGRASVYLGNAYLLLAVATIKAPVRAT